MKTTPKTEDLKMKMTFRGVYELGAEGQRMWDVDFADCIDSPRLSHDCHVNGLDTKSHDVLPKLM